MYMREGTRILMHVKVFLRFVVKLPENKDLILPNPTKTIESDPNRVFMAFALLKYKEL